MRRGIGLAALVLSMLSACSDPEAGTLPSASPSISITAPPTSTPTTSTAELEEAARAYYRTLERVSADPDDADALESLIDRRCGCHEVVDLLHDLANKRHRLLFTVTLGKPRVANDERDSGTVFIDVSQSAGREVNAQGDVVRTLPATHGTYVVDMVRANDRWLVLQITRT